MRKIKMGQMPGDISRQAKAAMLEGKHKDKVHSKAFKDYMKERTKPIERRRSKAEEKKAMDGGSD